VGASLIDGKAIAKAVRSELKPRVAALIERGHQPGLTVVLLGNNPASETYVKAKANDCVKLGMRSEVLRLPEITRQDELLQVISRLNADPGVDGILVQLPLPAHIAKLAILEAINPNKDVDGFHPINIGRLQIGAEAFLPCTPYGVIVMLKRSDIEIAGRRAVVVGRSDIVGKPIAQLLLQEHATVTVCHSRTNDLRAVTREADILIAAIGKPRFIVEEMVKPGATVIDVGINRVGDVLVGDVDFERVREVAGAITPVPGGVGPMTRAMLMNNTVVAAERFSGK